MLDVPLYGSSVSLASRFQARLLDMKMSMRYIFRNAVLSNRIAAGLFRRKRKNLHRTDAYKKAACMLFDMRNELNETSSWITHTQCERMVQECDNLEGIYSMISVIMYFKQLEQRFSGELSFS